MNAARFENRIPKGDDRERKVCVDCGHVAYENPKPVVGSVVATPDGRVLLCKRAIMPSRGFWTLPAGYMEMGETIEAGPGAREMLGHRGEQLRRPDTQGTAVA